MSISKGTPASSQIIFLEQRVAEQDAEIERLRSFEAANKMNSAQVAAQRLVVENQNAEIERLRAALREIDVGEGWAAQIARAALEEKP